MQEIKKHNLLFKGEELVTDIRVADRFLGRLIGLMFKDDIKEGNGLLIKACNSVHTFFMKFEMDALFLTPELEVVKVVERMKPWRMTSIYMRASQVLELRGGTIDGKIKKGDKVELVCIN